MDAQVVTTVILFPASAGGSAPRRAAPVKSTSSSTSPHSQYFMSWRATALGLPLIFTSIAMRPTMKSTTPNRPPRSFSGSNSMPRARSARATAAWSSLSFE